MDVARRIVLVGADSARARGYVSALAAAGHTHRLRVTSYGPVQPERAPTPLEGHSHAGLYYPELSVPLKALCESHAVPFEHVDAPSINAQPVLDQLITDDADLAVFAGLPGEIVRAATLRAAPRMLHLHPGKLPEQRGSTTLFYSVLEQVPTTVSGIILDEEIDAGPVVAERQFSRPPPGIDLDYLFDTAIRAATLVDIISSFARHGSLRLRGKQDVPASEEHLLYFVIHPVLKHLALLAKDRT